ncbi:uncharacterized protein LOC143275042 [Babylonia areolata]|uniref:uncharacterized protein LOC143275042 n=1 Tax=Babylonia areolata TaxID=304850 RepID=UPI003FD1F8C5
MVCKRRMQRLRSRNWLAIIIVVVLFLGIYLTYSTLAGHDANSRLRTYFPTIQKQALLSEKMGKNMGLSSEILHFSNQHPFMSQDPKPNKRVLHQVNSPEARIQEVLSLLYPRTWVSAKEADEMAIVLKDRMLELNLSSPMSCGDIGHHQLQGSLGYSRRKFVERLDVPRNSYSWADPYNNNHGYQQQQQQVAMMAVKSQSEDPMTRGSCLKEVHDIDFCSAVGNYLLMREVFLLRFLRHPNLIGLLGYCLRGDAVSRELDKKGVVLVLEMGVPFIPSLLSALSWSRRVQLAHGVVSLMAYLHHSPLGSVGLPQVKPKDFVLVNEKVLKLTDLDDAELQERACSGDGDCFLENVDIGVTCKGGRCWGLNQKTNMRMLGGPLLLPLLQNSPAECRKEVEEMLSRVRHLDISTKELLAFMDLLLKKYSAFEAQPSSDNTQRRENAESNSRYPDGHGIPAAKPKIVAGGSGQQLFRRLDASNFPGLYDYVCPHTRVHWGCVLVVESVQAAMDWCATDPTCRSFVAFSSHPEDSGKVAVVFKNNNVGEPKVSAGTTLYLLRDDIPQPQVHDGQEPPLGRDRAQETPAPPPPAAAPGGEAGGAAAAGAGGGGGAVVAAAAQEEEGDSAAESSIVGHRDKWEGRKEDQGGKETTKADPWARAKEVEACVLRVQEAQEEALRSREKRLMSAMGMKSGYILAGVFWNRANWRATGNGQCWWRRSPATPGSVRWGLGGEGEGAGNGDESPQGGSMVVHFNTSTAGHSLTQAVFMVERGQHINHVAFAVLYAIDRLLGLYHVPPTSEGFLRGSVVTRFAGNNTWNSVFGPLTHPDGSLRGLFVAKTPKTVKPASLTLQPLTRLTSEVKAFNQTEKSQLEYVVLLWLGHVATPDNLHHGVKGHLLHLDGDRSFQDLEASYEGFFNHCQFPNVAYKMLQCFRCKRNRICLLGQEVVRKVTESGFKLSDLRIPGLTAQDFPGIINTAASQIMEIVETCIQKFGRESVLY